VRRGGPEVTARDDSSNLRALSGSVVNLNPLSFLLFKPKPKRP